MRVRINGEIVTLTDETLEKTWERLELNVINCITEVLFNGVHVNNIVDFMKWRLSQLKEIEERTMPINLGFIQLAYHIQTGESIPILPRH